MNARAAEAANELRKQAANDPTATLVFDIFSDDPKFIEHEVDGVPVTDADPDLFWCEHCGRVFVDHYTWERYQSDGKCLNCARKEYLANPDNWLPPHSLLTLSQLKKVPHLLAVGQDTPTDLILVDEVETLGNTPISILNELNEITRRETRPMVVFMNAAYQFSVTYGVYVRKEAE